MDRVIIQHYLANIRFLALSLCARNLCLSLSLHHVPHKTADLLTGD